jgi:hypothetical protein
MGPRFTPCPACARHVKQSDSRCPFCGNEVPRVNAPARATVRRLSRSALFAAGAAGLALATVDCSSSSEPPYGVPPLVDAAPGDDSTDASDGSSTTPNDAAGDAGSADGGLDGAVTPPSDGRTDGG